MVGPATPAVLHALTPGNPVYAVLKIGAIGGIIALRFGMGRRKRDDDTAAEPEAIEVAPPVREPHPVSKKKKRKRRRA
jgi:hypothetical protein